MNSMNWYFFWGSILVALALFRCTTFEKSSYRVENNIVYKTVDGLKLTGNIYLPEGKDLKPAVLVLHGGGWVKKSGDLESVCKDLAKAGYVVFQPNYRLAPQHLFPKAVEDVNDALKWMQDNAQQYSIDSQRIAGWGYSAGGHLILMAGLDPHSGLKAIVSGGTPADLTAWPKSPLVFDFLGSSLKDKPDLWKAASPINKVVESSPPVFLYHGTLDSIVEYEQMSKMKNALEIKHCIVETHTVSYMGHLAVYVFSQESVNKGIDFINRKLK